MRRRVRGRLAVHVVLPVAGLAVIAGLAACSTTAPPTPSPEPTPTVQTTLLTSVEAGECYDPATPEAVVVVDCAEPHAYEVFASLLLTDPDYDAATIDATATARCQAAFEAFVGVEFEASELRLRLVVPSRRTWDEGDREVLCVVAAASGPTIGTLEHAAR